MRWGKLATGSVLAAAVVLAPTAAMADSCINASRPAPANDNAGGTGNWIWLPDIGVPFEAWGFHHPQTGSLLVSSAHCGEDPPNDKRLFAGDPATWHGIQTGCLHHEG
jgi:hypothetical protein